MPRPRLSPRREIHLYLPEELMARADLLLANPLLGRRRHGSLNTLFTTLLRDWLAEQGPQATPTLEDLL